MKKLTQTNNQHGFTLVEVMIVLGIGAAIIALALIVVPTVLRNQRDTARQNGITVLHAALVRWSNSRNGKLPNTRNDIEDALAGSTLAYYGELKTADNSIGNKRTSAYGEILQLSFFGDVGGINKNNHYIPGPNQIQFVNKAKCVDDISVDKSDGTGIKYPRNDGKDIMDSGSDRAFAIIYALEGEAKLQCIDNT